MGLRNDHYNKWMLNSAKTKERLFFTAVRWKNQKYFISLGIFLYWLLFNRIIRIVFSKTASLGYQIHP